MSQLDLARGGGFRFGKIHVLRRQRERLPVEPAFEALELRVADDRVQITSHRRNVADLNIHTI